MGDKIGGAVRCSSGVMFCFVMIVDCGLARLNAYRLFITLSPLAVVNHYQQVLQLDPLEICYHR